jgi:hypothetical protein
VTSGNASIFSLRNVTTPKIASRKVAVERDGAPVNGEIDELVEHGGAELPGLVTRTICTRRARPGPR